MSPVTDWEALAKDAKEVETKFEPAPEGNYNLTITEVKPDISKEGNQKFSATMVIDSGPYKGKKLWHDFTVARGNKRGLSIFFQNMAVLGMPFEFFNANTADEEVVNNMLHKRISADLLVDEYNPEKPKNKIDKGWSIKAPTGPSELDQPSAPGVPGGSSGYTTPPLQQPAPQAPQTQAYTNGAPPAQQYQQQAPQPQAPSQYQPTPPQVQQQHEDPWQPPQPPPPPANATWTTPPPAPPGLSQQ